MKSRLFTAKVHLCRSTLLLVLRAQSDSHLLSTQASLHLSNRRDNVRPRGPRQLGGRVRRGIRDRRGHAPGHPPGRYVVCCLFFCVVLKIRGGIYLRTYFQLGHFLLGWAKESFNSNLKFTTDSSEENEEMLQKDWRGSFP